MVNKGRIMIVVIIIIFTGCSSSLPESHLLSIENDNDRDYLTDSVEYYFYLDSLNSDTDGDTVLDGVQLALEFYERIGYLPDEPIEYGPYIINEPIYGQEICPICGWAINLGRIIIINPLNNLADTIPYIGLHYLKNGSFSYRSDCHTGSIEPVKLYKILRSITK